MTGTSCSLPSSKEDPPELTHIRSAYKRRQGVNRATSARSASETAAAPCNVEPVRSNLGSFVDHLFKYHYPCDHEQLGATTHWGRAFVQAPHKRPKSPKTQVPCGKILVNSSDKSETVLAFMPVAGCGQLKVRDTTTLQPSETSKSLD